MSLSTLLKIGDEIMLELVNDEYGLFEKQVVLNEMIDTMMI